MKTVVGVLIFDVNRSRIGVGFCYSGAGLESESQKRDCGHLCLEATKTLMFCTVCFVFQLRKCENSLI